LAQRQTVELVNGLLKDIISEMSDVGCSYGEIINNNKIIKLWQMLGILNIEPN
jgi:hypothetical protein